MTQSPSLPLALDERGLEAATERLLSIRRHDIESGSLMRFREVAGEIVRAYISAVPASQAVAERELLMAIEQIARMAEQGVLSADGGLAATEIRSLVPLRYRSALIAQEPAEGAAPDEAQRKFDELLHVHQTFMRQNKFSSDAAEAHARWMEEALRFYAEGRHYNSYRNLETGDIARAALSDSPAPTKPEGAVAFAEGVEHYPLRAAIWRRDDEWVLELEGKINDTYFIHRHTEPRVTAPEDVASLPSLYGKPEGAVNAELLAALKTAGCTSPDGTFVHAPTSAVLTALSAPSPQGREGQS